MTPQTAQRSLTLLNLVENGLGGLHQPRPDDQRNSGIDQMQQAVRELQSTAEGLTPAADAKHAITLLGAVDDGLTQLRAAMPDDQRFAIIGPAQAAVQELRGVMDLPTLGQMDATIDKMLGELMSETPRDQRALLEQTREGLRKTRPS